jgi:hypothetical protein
MTLKGEAKGYCPDRVHSGQMVLGTVRWGSGPRERWPKAFKTKLAQGAGPSGLSQFRSDGSRDGQVGGRTLGEAAKKNNSRKPRHLVIKLA